MRLVSRLPGRLEELRRPPAGGVAYRPLHSKGKEMGRENQEPMQARALDWVRAYRAESCRVLERIPDREVVRLIELLEAARREGRQVFLCGNGGSAATASHFANDLGKGASLGRPRRFRVLSLADNVSWVTALANDTDYSRIFVEQLRNYAQAGDVLVAFSGSGNSPNVLEALKWAREAGLVTVGVTGRPGGRVTELAELPIVVESAHMGHIEEGHFLIQHLAGYFFMEAEPEQGRKDG